MKTNQRRTSAPDHDVIALADTDASAINRTLNSLPNQGSGLVFTLVVVVDSRHYRSALNAAIDAGRQNPSRILVAVKSRAQASRLDAEVRNSDDVPGDIVTLKMSGEVTHHPESVVLPLLLPDLPVVVWWPAASPRDPVNDPLGRLGSRRITDCTGAHHPVQALLDRAGTHASGTTDLTWTRVTSWRALLVAALDQVRQPVTAARVEAPQDTAPAELMTAWLESRLGVRVDRHFAGGPGHIQGVHLTTAGGTISLVRTGDREAIYSVPGQPDRPVALQVRSTHDLLSEELRRLDADRVFDDTVAALLKRRAMR